MFSSEGQVVIWHLFTVRQNCSEVQILYWSLRFDPCSSGNYPLLASSSLVYLFSYATPKYLKIINSLVLLGFAFKNSNTLWTRNIPPTSFMWEHRNAREKERLSQISSELLQIASEAKQRVKWILRTPRQSSSYRKSFLTTWHYYLLE